MGARANVVHALQINPRRTSFFQVGVNLRPRAEAVAGAPAPPGRASAGKEPAGALSWRRTARTGRRGRSWRGSRRDAHAARPANLTYADNIAIEEGRRQPVPFRLGKAMRLTDAYLAELSVTIVDIVGRSALLEYRPWKP